MSRNTLSLVCTACCGALLLLATAVPATSSPAGVPIPDSQADAVRGGSSTSIHILEAVLGSHDYLLDTTTTTYCGGTYTGCGGGACGTYVQHDLSSLPGNRDFSTRACSTKTCGMTQVSCGSGSYDVCV